MCRFQKNLKLRENRIWAVTVKWEGATCFIFLFWKIRCRDFGQNGQKNELLNPAARGCYGSVILLIPLREEMSGALCVSSSLYDYESAAFRLAVTHTVWWACTGLGTCRVKLRCREFDCKSRGFWFNSGCHLDLIYAKGTFNKYDTGSTVPALNYCMERKRSDI